MTVSVQCFSCRHYRGLNAEHRMSCDAFPDGIPPEIARGEFAHTEPYPGDNGVRFEPVDEDAN